MFLIANLKHLTVLFYTYGVKLNWLLKFCVEVPYFPAYSARALSIQTRSEIVENEHARYTLERFPTDNARVIYTKKI
jgi:hypothetical protein